MRPRPVNETFNYPGRRCAIWLVVWEGTCARTRIGRFRIFSEPVTTHASPAGRFIGSRVVKPAIAQRPVAQTRAAQRLDIDNTPPRLRTVTYQLALLLSALKSLVYNISAISRICRAPVRSPCP